MAQRTARSRENALVLVGALLSPLTFITIMTVIGHFNLVDLGFWKTFSVANATQSDVWITPIGAIDEAGRRRCLPYSRRQNTFSAQEQSEFYIPRNGSRTFVYDWDDIQFSEILIRTSDGPYRILPTGLHPTKIQFQAPKPSSFVIKDLEILAAAEATHLKALDKDSGYRRLIVNFLAAAGLVSPLLLFLAIRQAQKTAAAEAQRRHSNP